MKISAASPMVRFGAVALALGVALALTGCLQSSTPLSLPTSTHPATHSAKPSAQPIPTPTPTSTPTRFVEDCGILLTQAQVYAYNPNYVADTAYSPKAGTVAAAIKSSEGQTCGWIDETSSVILEVGVATPGAAGLASARAAASTGTPITADGEQGYFGVANGIGSAQFFFGRLWLDVSSQDFTVPADAAAVYSVVVQNQLSAGG